MTLLEHIKKRRISIRKFSFMYDFDYTKIYRICKGELLPSLVDAFKIEAITEGVVKPKSFLKPEQLEQIKTSAKWRCVCEAQKPQ